MGLIFLILSIFIVGLLLPIFALIDILGGTFKESNDKVIWVIVVLLLPLLGSVLYFLIGSKQKTN